MSQNEILIETRELCKFFGGKRTLFDRNPPSVHAVDNISLSIHAGETLGLVGESGCGKSTLGRTILRLTPQTSGKVFYRGEDIFGYKKEKVRLLRQKMQIIFQDPYGSLNPRMTVQDLVGAPLDVFHLGTKAERREKIIKILDEVGIGSQHLSKFPHEFSGGQRQRIGIARALILDPEFVVCDEPVSALDVSVRAQVLNLLKEFQKSRGLTYLFVSHDLSVVKHISDRIAVMYLGKIVEITTKQELYLNPRHPYTIGLLASIPIPDTRIARKPAGLIGDIPTAYNPPSGCRFHTRCPHATDKCKTDEPLLAQLSPDHSVACHYAKL